jgi:hypothetical protein
MSASPQKGSSGYPEIFSTRHEQQAENTRVLVLSFRDFFGSLHDRLRFEKFGHVIVEQAAVLEEQLLYHGTTVVSLNRLSGLFQKIELELSDRLSDMPDIVAALKTLQESIPFFFAYLGIYAKNARSDWRFSCSDFRRRRETERTSVVSLEPQR